MTLKNEDLQENTKRLRFKAPSTILSQTNDSKTTDDHILDTKLLNEQKRKGKVYINNAI